MHMYEVIYLRLVKKLKLIVGTKSTFDNVRPLDTFVFRFSIFLFLLKFVYARCKCYLSWHDLQFCEHCLAGTIIKTVHKHTPRFDIWTQIIKRNEQINDCANTRISEKQTDKIRTEPQS